MKRRFKRDYAVMEPIVGGKLEEVNRESLTERLGYEHGCNPSGILHVARLLSVL